MKLIKLILIAFICTNIWFIENNTANMSFSSTNYIGISEYIGCQDGSEALRNHTLSGVVHVLNSQSAYYVDKRIEFGLLNIDNQQIIRLKEPTDISACEQINNVLNEYQVAWNDPLMSPVYYEAGGFFFASFGLHTGKMLGFRPIYMFNDDFELIFIWVV